MSVGPMNTEMFRTGRIIEWEMSDLCGDRAPSQESRIGEELVSSLCTSLSFDPGQVTHPKGLLIFLSHGTPWMALPHATDGICQCVFISICVSTFSSNARRVRFPEFTQVML